MEETYRFDEDSYQRLHAAGIGWQSVLDVLQARPRWRQHIGAVLRIAAPDRAGRGWAWHSSKRTTTNTWSWALASWTPPSPRRCAGYWNREDRDGYQHR